MRQDLQYLTMRSQKKGPLSIKAVFDSKLDQNGFYTEGSSNPVKSLKKPTLPNSKKEKALQTTVRKASFFYSN
jgi:hypothetical protein